MFVFSDFDGTLTDKNQLGPKFWDLLFFLKQKNAELIIVTGRSVSWGHFLLTHFPLKYCIMEGGGVILHKSGKYIQQHINTSQDAIDRIRDASDAIEKKFGSDVLSRDSFGRLTDRAIETPLLPADTVEQIREFLRSEHISFDESNVHLNFWGSDVAKYDGVVTLHKLYLSSKMSLSELCNTSYYFGDSPNDQSIFKHFHNSVGVSNIGPYLSKLDHRPKTILTGDDHQEIHGVLRYLEKHL